MNNWPIKKLNEVSTVVSGGTPKTGVSSYWNGNVLWLTPKELSRYRDIYVNNTERKITDDGLKNSSAKSLPKGTVLLTTRAPIGYVAIAGQELCTNQGFKNFICDSEQLDNRFLFYWLKGNNDFLQSLGQGATFTEINKTNVERIEIPVPPLKIQREIVEHLEEIRKAQELNDLQISETQKLYSALLYKEIEQNDYSKVKLSEICKFEGGTQPPKSTFIYEPKEGYIRLLQIRDYKNDNRAAYIPMTARYKSCTKQDIMIGRYGPPVFQILRGKEGAYNVALMKCIPDNNKITNDWLFYFLNTESVQKKIISLSMRLRQAGVNPKDLDNLDIPLPSTKEQQKIVSKLDSTQHYKQMLLKQKVLLEELFDSVLQKSMKGELDS